MLNNKKVILIGAGTMAEEYAKVLRDMDVEYVIVGNRKENADKMRDRFDVQVYDGGIDKFIKSNGIDSDNYYINAVNVKNISYVSKKILSAGAKNLLIEKPGFIEMDEALSIEEMLCNCNIYIAYNRRFYESVNRGLEIIDEDGGVKSLFIEFTEWRHVFDNMQNKDYLNYLFFSNSMHVIDMAFFLAGSFSGQFSSYIGGENAIDWHKIGSIFSGAGELDNGVLFSYIANWNSAGRWRIEVNTNKHRLIYSPLEKLQLMDIGSVKIYEADIDYEIDEKYKPGLYREVESFLNGNINGKLCSLSEQIKYASLCQKISGEIL